MPIHVVSIVFVSLLMLLSLTGCKETENKPNSDKLTLSYADFVANVNPVLNLNIGGKTCSASGCHNVNGGSGGAFKIFANAVSTSELTANFISAKSFANLVSASESKLLLEPLTGTFSSVGSHAGGDIFTLGDANYTIIFNWINNPVSN